MVASGDTGAAQGPGTQPDDGHSVPGRRLLIGFAALLVIAVVLSRRQRLPTVAGVPAERLEPLAHGVLAALIALVISFSLNHGPPGPRSLVRRPVLSAVIGSALITNLVEVGQLLVPHRAASWGDLAANSLGALIGGGLAIGLSRLPVVAAVRVLGAVVVSGILGGLWAAAVDVPLGQSCPHSVVDAPAAVPQPELANDLVLASYALDRAEHAGGQLVVPEASGGSPLRSVGSGIVASSPAGVVFPAAGPAALLRSLEAGRLIGSVVRDNQSLHVEVVATPTTLAEGPVPIVAVSSGLAPSASNIQIGQHGRELSVRLRLHCGQFNWTRIGDVFAVDQRRHVVVTFAEARQRIWVDGQLVDERHFSGELTNTGNWDLDMPLVVGNEPTEDRQFVGEVERVRIGLLAGEGSG